MRHVVAIRDSQGPLPLLLASPGLIFVPSIFVRFRKVTRSSRDIIHQLGLGPEVSVASHGLLALCMQLTQHTRPPSMFYKRNGVSLDEYKFPRTWRDLFQGNAKGLDRSRIHRGKRKMIMAIMVVCVLSQL